MKSEFQAVILAAGKGSRMTELTNKIPKCLLPIGNKPMIHFPLTMLIEADFKDVIIIISDIYENEIKSKLSDYKINIDFVSIPYKQDLGTADSLKRIHYKLFSDVLVLSCDLISNYPLRNLINFNRINDSPLCILIANGSSTLNKGFIPGFKGQFKTDRDIVGIDSQNSNRIVLLNSEIDFENFIDLKLSMIKLCQNVDISTEYLDGHCYIFKKYLIDYLINEETMSSVKGEFVPSIIKNQFRFNDQHNSHKIDASKLKDKNFLQENAYVSHNRLKNELDRFDPLIGENLQMKSLDCPDSMLSCLPVIVDSKKYFISRSNNILSYYEINKLFKSLIPEYQNADFGPGRHITTDCLIGDHNKISDKTTIKKTIIGNNCVIQEKVFLENCLIMNNVIIGEQCLIKNSIICNNAKILKKSKLTDCIISADEEIAESTILTNESVYSDQMFEI